MDEDRNHEQKNTSADFDQNVSTYDVVIEDGNLDDLTIFVFDSEDTSNTTKTESNAKLNNSNELISDNFPNETSETDKLLKNKRGYRQYCSVYNCSTNNKNSPHLSFFRYPKDQKRCKKWLTNCGRKELLEKSSLHLYSNQRVCSSHFEDFMFSNVTKTRLNRNAVPTPFDSIKKCHLDKKLDHKINQKNNENEAIETVPNISEIQQSGNCCVGTQTDPFVCTREERRKFRTKIGCLRRKIRSLESKLNSRSAELCSLSSEQMLVELEKKVPEEAFYLLKSVLKVGGGKERYSRREQDFFCAFHLQARTGYKFLRDRGIHVPHPKTIERWKKGTKSILNTNENKVMKSETNVVVSGPTDDELRYSIAIISADDGLPEITEQTVTYEL